MDRRKKDIFSKDFDEKKKKKKKINNTKINWKIMQVQA